MPSPPAPLTWLIARLSRLIATATDSLESAYPDGVDAWQQELSRQLARYHGAAMLAGAGVDSLSKPMETAVTTDLATQLRFLGKFAVEMQDGDQWVNGWNSRANMYAGAIKLPFNQGYTRMLPLPSMPTEGTTCLTRCGCMWEIDWIDEANGDADAYWRLGKTESCAICKQRAQDWSPVRIRKGVLQL